MILDCTVKGQVKINMVKCVKDMIKEFPEMIKKESPTPKQSEKTLGADCLKLLFAIVKGGL